MYYKGLKNVRRFLLPAFIALLDILCLIVSLFLALILRFDGKIPSADLWASIQQAPFFILIMFAVHCLLRLYTRVWRYAGSVEGITILGAVVLDALLWFGFSFLWGSYLPRSIYILTALVFLVFMGFIRFALRIYSYITSRPAYLRKVSRRNVLIFGAGDAGAMLLREMYNHQNNRRVVGFIDDDVKKRGQIFSGVRILGTRKDLAELVDTYMVQEIFIAMPSVKGQAMREVVNACKATGVEIKTLPGVYELIDGAAHINQLRPVAIEDLLGRDTVVLDDTAVQLFLRGKVLLVTGSCGSIGSEICRQAARMQPQKILLLGKGENSIYEISRELRISYPNLKTVPIIADVRDRERIHEVMRIFGPQVVVHAAAHKHVPLMEYQPMEAVRNNVLGTKVMAEESAAVDVEKFIMISTDKAVNPTSVMGCTKRVAEMFVQSMNTAGVQTRYVAVRFGNVLGSRGSVIPLFKKQIAAGGPVTVTDPEMKRYFMTIPEASQLVLQAGAMARGGEVFVLDMGEPVKIVDLARDLISLSGLQPDVDIQIEYTGL